MTGSVGPPHPDPARTLAARTPSAHGKNRGAGQTPPRRDVRSEAVGSVSRRPRRGVQSPPSSLLPRAGSHRGGSERRENECRGVILQDAVDDDEAEFLCSLDEELDILSPGVVTQRAALGAAFE